MNEAYEAGDNVVCAAGNLVQDVAAPARLARTLEVVGVGVELSSWGSSHGVDRGYRGLQASTVTRLLVSHCRRT